MEIHRPLVGRKRDLAAFIGRFVPALHITVEFDLAQELLRILPSGEHAVPELDLGLPASQHEDLGRDATARLPRHLGRQGLIGELRRFTIARVYERLRCLPFGAEGSSRTAKQQP